MLTAFRRHRHAAAAFFEHRRPQSRLTTLLVVVGILLVHQRHASPLESHVVALSSEAWLNGDDDGRLDKEARHVSAATHSGDVIGQPLDDESLLSDNISGNWNVENESTQKYNNEDLNNDLLSGDIISQWKRRSMLGLDNLDFAARTLDLARGQNHNGRLHPVNVPAQDFRKMMQIMNAGRRRRKKRPV